MNKTNHNRCKYLGNDAWDCSHIESNSCDCHVCSLPPKVKPIRQTRIRLGAKVKNKLGIQVPRQCKHCGDVWKQVEEIKQGRRIIKRRVKCYSCGKRLYGNRAKV